MCQFKSLSNFVHIGLSCGTLETFELVLLKLIIQAKIQIFMKNVCINHLSGYWLSGQKMLRRNSSRLMEFDCKCKSCIRPHLGYGDILFDHAMLCT